MSDLKQQDNKHDEFQTRVQHLLTTGAFTLKNTNILKSKSPRQTVERGVFLHQRFNKDLKSVPNPLSYLQLKDRYASRKRTVDPELYKVDPAKSRLVLSSENPMEIRNCNRKILGYRFRLPEKFLKNLEESVGILLKRKEIKKQRGEFEPRHYALWACYSKQIYLNLDYMKEKEQVDKCFEYERRAFHLSF